MSFRRFNPVVEFVVCRTAAAEHIPAAANVPPVDPWPAAGLPESLQSDRKLLALTSPSGLYAIVGGGQ